MSGKRYWVYMLTNPGRTMLYIGVTNSLGTRMDQHKRKAGSGFTKKYNCQWLMYYEEFAEINQAIAREKQLKGWTRSKKEELIATVNPEWADLSGEWVSN
jgi:putative endonuclease